MRAVHKPMIMGLLMGPMMLWMLHGQLTGGSISTAALAAFIGAHVALVLVVVTGGIFAARLSSRMRARIDRLHRPSLRHIGWMFAAAVLSAGAVHLALHGLPF